MKVRLTFIVATFIVAFTGLDCHLIGLRRQQNDAISTPSSPPLRPLPWGEINFIHTTDNHGKLVWRR
jgi:2',3'-cyclic-nucleotide 2'-phosphodiesterase (5'-nucleotidase family)